MATATPATKKAPATTKKPAAKPPAKKTAPPAKKAPAAKTPAPVKKAAPAKAPAAKKTGAKPTSSKPAKPTGVKPPTGTAFAGVEMGSDLLSMTQVWLRHDEIVPDFQNLRQTLTEIDDLANSIASVGLLEPILVSLASRPEDLIAGSNPYVIIAGHRRHAAIGMLIADGRWPAERRIACIVGPEPGLSDEDRTVQMLIENLQRVDLNPIEEALGYKRLVDAGWKQTRIAQAVGRHQNRVSERMQLIRLPEQWRPAIANGEISLGLAATLTGLTAGAIEILTKEKRLPDKNTIDAAIRKDRIDTAVATTKAAAKERGLIYSPNKGSWQMHDHVREIDTTPDKLAKVLLPPDVTGWEVTLETYTDPAKVTVWRRTTPITPAAEPTELTPYDQWHKECQVARRDHQAALAAFADRCKAVEIEWARTVETKTVAAALMQFEVAVCGEAEDWALDLGWKKPDVDDPDIIDAHLQEWYNHAANISAALARMLGHQADTPESFKKLRLDYLQAAGLGEPPPLVLPLAPGIEAVNDGDEPADGDGDDELDENAHLEEGE